MMKQKLNMLAIMLFIGTSVIAQDSTIKKSFNGIKEIELNTASGDCIIEKGGPGIELNLTYTYDDDVFTPVIEQEGSVLILKEKFKKNSRTSGSSKWKLKIPDNIEFDFNTGSGDLNANNITLTVKSNTGSGDIDMNKVSGDVKVNTGSGETNISAYDGNLKINTGSGDVDISDSKGKFSINLGSGNVDAHRLTGKFKMNVGSGDIDGDGLNITEASSFNSGSGNAEVTLSSKLNDDISVNSGSGDAVLIFNGNEIEGEITMKANKRHGEISAPFKFDSVTEEEQGNQTIVKKTVKIGNSDIQIKVSTGSGRAVIKK